MKKILAVFITCMTINAQTPKKVTLQKFGESDLLVIHTQKGFSTLIEFPEGQGIQEVTCGDKEFWVVEGKGRFLHVKPAKEGITTNLNVLLEGDVIYSFLLKEISRAGNMKPDLRIIVNGGDEPAKIRKEKDNLEEALARSERALKDLSDKYDAEKKQGAKKNTTSRQEIDDPAAKSDPVPVVAKPLLEGSARPGGTSPSTGIPGLAQPPAGEAVAPEETPIASSYVVARRGGLIRAGGRRLKHVFQKINNAIHLY